MPPPVRQVPSHPPGRSILLLRGVGTDLDSRREIGRNLFVARVDEELIRELEESGLTHARELIGDLSVLIESRGTTSTDDLLRPHAFSSALILATDVGLQPAVHIITEEPPQGKRTVTGTDLPLNPLGICWGHGRTHITAEDLVAAEKLWLGVSKVLVTDKHHRVGNALLFYRNGYASDNPDLALVAFTTCLESLFSTGGQEISFQLAVRVAHFLGDSKDRRREVYEQCREVYRIRSKVVHGAPINKRSTEQSAIYLVEGIVPQAEHLARNALKKVFELKLEGTFDNPQKIDAIFEESLFSDSLEDVLRIVGQ